VGDVAVGDVEVGACVLIGACVVVGATVLDFFELEVLVEDTGADSV
jgi:hypothetical protein